MSVSIAATLRDVQWLSDRVSKCKDYSRCQNEIREVSEKSEGIRPHVVNLFDQLKSQDSSTVQKAEREIQHLQGMKGFSFHKIVLHSFPLWPTDYSALKEIALDQSESMHPLLQKRVLEACSCLVTYGAKEGYEVAAVVAAKKMRSKDEAIQKEGFQYFTLFVGQWDLPLPKDDLALAISIAKKICMTEECYEASTFFKKLIQYREQVDITPIKSALLELCASDNGHAFYVGCETCKKMISRHFNSQELIAIPLNAATIMCASEKSWRRDNGFNLFWELLRWSPSSTIDPLLQALELESLRTKPVIGILGMLEELAGHNFSNLFCRTEDVVLQREKANAPTLLRILTNLSEWNDNSYVQEKALKFKQMVESRHPLLRERGLETCHDLAIPGAKEAYGLAATEAFKKMGSEDEVVQKEGFQSLALIMDQWHLPLSHDDFILAISVAKKICMTKERFEVDLVFKQLIQYGKKIDIAPIKSTVLELCAADNKNASYVGRTICEEIITRHHKCKELIAIPLEAITFMCASNMRFRRSEGFDLFWKLLSWSPALAMDPLLQALETESQREWSSFEHITMTCVFSRLEELAGHNFSNLSSVAKEVILKRAKEDAPTLLRILTNFSKCHDSFTQKEALKLKQMVESRIDKA